MTSKESMDLLNIRMEVILLADKLESKGEKEIAAVLRDVAATSSFEKVADAVDLLTAYLRSMNDF